MTDENTAELSLDVALQQAVEHHQLGRLQEAEQLYRSILGAVPNHADTNHNLGVIAVQVGQPAEALHFLKVAMATAPGNAHYVASYAQTLLSIGHFAEALNTLEGARAQGLDTPQLRALLEQAQARATAGGLLVHGPLDQQLAHLVELFNSGRYPEMELFATSLVERTPGFGIGWKALGVARQLQGKDTLDALQKAADLLPNDAETHCNLGNALRDKGQTAAALICYRRALNLQPDLAEAHSNLGNALRDLGQSKDAVASYRRALEINPNYAEAYFNLGITQRDLKQYEPARGSYERALAISPSFHQAHYELGSIFERLGQLQNAAASYERAAIAKPDYVDAHINLGNVLRGIGRLEGSVTSYERALHVHPTFAEVHGNLANAFRDLGRLDDAIASYYKAIELKPQYAEAHSNLGNVLQEVGRFDEALAAYKNALELNPDFAEAASNLLICLSHSPTVSAPALFAEHRRIADSFEAPLRNHWPKHTNTRDPARRLQVGFVSGDLYNHAVTNFLEPVLVHLAAIPQLSLHAYYNHVVEDSVTQRLKGHLPHWNSVVGLTDEALAEKIQADRIDILIDLSGHSALNRLLTFARKPAPVQLTWMGFPGTTGLQAMDYYLSDQFFLPSGQFDDQFTEKIVHLPASAAFQPSLDAPPVNALPAQDNGYVTFGSFNRPAKISRAVVALWSQLLRAMPSSRMVLGAMPKEGQRNAVLEWFDQEGIDHKRLSIYEVCGMKDYQALHHQVDICLDTFPYNGGTTTLHALWMGVPTLTLVGGTPAGRTGASILGHVGLHAYMATDADEFVQKGLQLAGDLAALSDLRAQLRGRFAESAMGQPAVVAAGLEQALRTMWQRWCDDRAPVAFTVI